MSVSSRFRYQRNETNYPVEVLRPLSRSTIKTLPKNAVSVNSGINITEIYQMVSTALPLTRAVFIKGVSIVLSLIFLKSPSLLKISLTI